MRRSALLRPIAAAVMVAAVAAQSVAARVDVMVDFDTTFDFKALRTWGWAAEGPGRVFMARTQEDDPEAARKQIEPVIIAALVGELSRVGLRSGAAKPDLLVTYYLLLTTTTSTQSVGQFVPAMPNWGRPSLPTATQSLEYMKQGSLVLDLSSGGKIIWRGIAQSKISMDADERQRRTLVFEAVRDLLRRYPSKG